MSLEKVKEYFKQYNMEGRIIEFDVSSATSTLAAEAIGCGVEQIAKTLSFKDGESCILLVCSGAVKTDNKKFKETFGFKAKMLTPEETESLVGHAVGGVCPFAVRDGLKIYLDESLRQYETVYAACGSSNSVIGLTIDELTKYSNALGWVDVCRSREEQICS